MDQRVLEVLMDGFVAARGASGWLVGDGLLGRIGRELAVSVANWPYRSRKMERWPSWPPFGFHFLPLRAPPSRDAPERDSSATRLAGTDRIQAD
jgi:hypothetical protein